MPTADASTATGGILLLVDAHALLHRSYHALPSGMRTATGMPTNALYGFALTILKAVEQFRPTHLAICFDAAEETLRKQSFPAYKAHRQAPEDDLIVQLEKAREIPDALGVKSFFGDGHEADDYLGSLAEYGKTHGLRVVILSGDKDMYQLVDGQVSVCILKTGIKDTALMTPEKILEATGLRPDQVVDYKGLRGDPSDNIPGVPGIGEITATKLLQRHGSLDEVYAHLEDDPEIKGKLKERLVANRELALQSRELARIHRTIPLSVNADELTFHPHHEMAVNLFAELEFRSLLPRLHALETFEGSAPSSAPVIQPTQAPPPPSQATQTSLFAPAEAAGATLAEPERAAVSFTPVIVRTSDELAACVRELAGAKILVIDTETPSLDAHTVTPCGISLAASTDRGFYLNLGHAGETLELAEVQRVLGPLLLDPTITKVGHNLKFDSQVLLNAGLELRGIEDTLLMAYLLAPGARGLGLDALALQELRYAMQPITDLIGKGKKQIPFNDVPLEAAAWYSVEDAITTLLLHGILRERLGNTGQLPFLERFEIPLIPILSAMERAGALIDVQHLQALGREVEAELATIEGAIHALVGHPFNLNSPRQVSEVLFHELALPTKGIRKTPQGVLSTAAEELEKLEHPVADKLLAFRELEKLRSTYIDALPKLVDASGRVHTSYNQAVAATGRLSSSDPNLQNIPIRSPLGRRIREAFVAPPGRRIVAADYSQIELRVLAHVSSDPNLTAVYREGRDIHAQTAAFLFGVRPEDVTKAQRSQAKTVNFGILYGMGPRRLARENGIPLSEATRFIEEYFASYPRVSQWMDEILAEARTTGFVTTFFGRRRYLPDLQSGRGQFLAQAERMAVNHPIQGTAADLMKLAMIRVAARLDGRTDARVILQVHDELVLEVNEDVVTEIEALLRTEMESVATLSVPLTVDVASGPNWGALRS